MVDLSFPYPMTLSGMGMVCSWALAVLCCYGLRWVEPTAHVTIKFWTTRILPIGFFMVRTSTLQTHTMMQDCRITTGLPHIDYRLLHGIWYLIQRHRTTQALTWFRLVKLRHASGTSAHRASKHSLSLALDRKEASVTGPR